MSDQDDLIVYLTDQMVKAYTDLAWQKGMLCLRCDPKGLPTIMDMGLPWCPLCGKDPLFHGPELINRVFYTLKNESDEGSNLARQIQHQLYQEVFHGGRTATPPRKGSTEPQ
jgi:hypothetical protein